MEAERPIEPPRPPADGVHVPASPLRCPFCHDGVDPLAADWVACKACLARHHAECWGEGGACGACGGSERLVMDPSRPPDNQLQHPAEYWRERELRRQREPARRRRRGQSGAASVPRPGAHSRAIYLRLQGAWTLLASLLAGGLHAALGMLAVLMGLASTAALVVACRHMSTSEEKRITLYHAAASALIMSMALLATFGYAVTTEGPSGALAGLLAMLAATAFVLGRSPTNRDSE